MPTFIDFETASLSDITDVGAYKYLDHPTTTIVVLALKDLDTGFQGVWDYHNTAGQNQEVLDYLEKLISSGSELVAHNADFEYVAFSKFPYVSRPKPEQFTCTAVMARRAGLASGLGFVAKTLGIPNQKDKAGKELIRFFHTEVGYNWLMGIEQPQKFTTKGKPKKVKTHVKIEGVEVDFFTAFKMYSAYCLQDIVVTEEIFDALSFFYPEDDVKDSFVHNLKMNERGYPVDVPMLVRANEIYERARKENTTASEELCGLRPSQNKALVAWLNERGWQGDSLSAAVVAESLERDDLDPLVRQVLEHRADGAFAAVKKIPAALATQVNGRIHGGFMFSGAVRTHRTAGKGVQPHNFKRPDKLAETFTKAFQVGTNTFETLETVFGNLTERIAMSARHFIREPKGLKMWNTDFSQIEARLTNYVPGQLDILDGFRKGLCPYTVMASLIFKLPYEQIGKESVERFVGKQAVLLCGYSGGAEKFCTTCLGYGQDIGMDLAEFAVSSYRANAPQVTKSWKDLSRGAVSAILKHPEWLETESIQASKQSKFEPIDTNVLEGKVSFSFEKDKTGLPTILARLYSGHVLSYPFPFLKRVKGKRHLCKSCRDAALEGKKIKCDCQEPFESLGLGYHKFEKGGMRREFTHGGKLLENVCQALAGDHLNFALREAEKRGFYATMVIHDEALGPMHPHLKIEDLDEAFQTPPPWAPDFPLKAEGKVVDFYTK